MCSLATGADPVIRERLGIVVAAAPRPLYGAMDGAHKGWMDGTHKRRYPLKRIPTIDDVHKRGYPQLDSVWMDGWHPQ